MATLVQRNNGSINTNGIDNDSYLVATGNQDSVIETSTGGLGGIEVQGPSNTRPAFMAFHRPGAYATYFGLDTDNIFKVGGWSMGAAKQRVFHGIADGSAPVFACRAWVNFNGTGIVGVNQSIRASGNITSVFKNGTGDYTINFTTAMPDANYCFQGSGFTSKTYNENDTSPLRTTTQIRISVREGSSSAYVDSSQVSIAIFR